MAKELSVAPIAMGLEQLVKDNVNTAIWEKLIATIVLPQEK